MVISRLDEPGVNDHSYTYGVAERPSDGARPVQRPRRRDPEGHRAAILAAAQELFAARGYEHATVREIAARAGVTHGSVMRHFGTKEELFVAAIPGVRDLDQIAPGPAETLPDRLAAAWVERMESVDGSDPTTALILSAADRDAAVRLYTVLMEQSMRVYSAVLGSTRDGDIRLQLMAAQLIGVTFTRYILRMGPLAELDPPELVTWLSSTLRGILFD
jgi:AcrR family transcriptional regulator